MNCNVALLYVYYLMTIFTVVFIQNSSAGEKASAYFQMMGGSVEELGGRMLGIDDGVCNYYLRVI